MQYNIAFFKSRRGSCAEIKKKKKKKNQDGLRTKDGMTILC